jgi:protein-L-isoaspartate(D-aspartate) O-methyltransferase
VRLRPMLLLYLLVCLVGSASEVDVYAERRAALIKALGVHIHDIAYQTGLEAMSATTRDAMLAVPRHLLVPEAERRHAYEDRPLPIGHSQTISQPTIVALMTDLLAVGKGDVVLEIGTGSAYQAAVLGQIVAQVYSIEIVEALAERAAGSLRQLGYGNVMTRHGDGYYGWPEQGPFDGIIVTAAAGHVPPPLIEQLKTGARLVIPVGGRFQTQWLLLVEKAGDGTLSTRQVLPVRFVPLTGER